MMQFYLVVLKMLGLNDSDSNIMFLWPCSLAVPVLAGLVYAFCGSLSRNSRRLNRQWFWFQSVSEDGATA